MFVNQSLPKPSDGAPQQARAVVAVEGPDAQAFLDALLTNAIPPPTAQAITYAAMLTPQGKVLFDGFVIGRGETGYVLDVPAVRAEGAVKRLMMFVLRRRVQIGPAADWTVSVLSPHLAGPDGATPFPDPRLPDLAVRWLGASPSLVDETFEARRIRAGVPDLSIDSDPDAVFGLEALLEELRGVDFKKGCFLGQENVSRMKRRATTRRKYCRVRFDGPAPVFGAPIRAGDMELGAMCSTSGTIGLALLRLDRARDAIAAGTTLECQGDAIHIDAPDWLIWPTEKDDA